MTAPRMTPRQLQRAVEQAIDDGEELLFAGSMAAIRWFLDHTRRAALGTSGMPDLDAFPPEQAWLDLVVLALNEPIEKVARNAYNRTAITIGADANTVDAYIVAHLADVADRLRMWPAGVFDDMRIELAEGLAAAEGIDQLRDRIGAVLDIDAPSRRIRQRLARLTADLAAAQTSAQRGKVRAKIRKLRLDLTEADRTWHAAARRIARTETTAAANGGAYAAALALDAAEPDTGIRKQWLATSDDRVRDEHAALNGQTVPLRQPFRFHGVHLDHPGDPKAPPHLTINCRCTMLIWPGGHEPLDLGPIGDVPAATASAQQQDTYHGQPGDHPMVGTGRSYVGNSGYRELRDMQAQRWSGAPLPSGFASAINDYVRDGYGPMNASLRGENPELSENVLALDEGFADARAILPDGATVYRGTKDVSMLAGLRPGDEFVDRGFSSTSFDGEAALDYFGKGVKIGSGKRGAKSNLKGVAYFTIKVPPGSRAIVPSAIGPAVRGEDELLLPRGTKYHIVDITTSPSGLTKVKLEVTDTPDQKSMWATTAAGAPHAESADGAVGPGVEDDTVDPDYGKFEWQPDDIEVVKDIQRPTTSDTDTDDDGLTAAAPEGDMTTPASRTLPDGWRGILAPLGVPSGDGRIIAEPEQLNHRPLPIPLLAQHQLDDGHLGAVVVGLHENVWIQDGQLWGEGPLDLADEDAQKWARRLADGYASGVSVDLDDVTMTMMMRNTASGELSDMPEPDDLDGDVDGLMILLGEPELPEGFEAMGVATKWRLMSATLVSQPAFAEASVQPVWGYTGPGTGSTTAPTSSAPEAAQTGERVMRQGTASSMTFGGKQIGHLVERVTVGPALRAGTPSPLPIKSKDGTPAPVDDDDEAAVKLPKVGDRVMVDNPDTGGPGEVTAVDAAADPPAVTVALDAGGEVTVPAEQVRPESEGTDTEGKPKQAPKQTGPPKAAASTTAAFRRALAASAAPLKPPADWFAPPPTLDLSKPTPLTITDDGRVFGMLATWGTCHIGYQDTCVTPPRTATDYALFHVGEVQCSDGTLVSVGKITVGAGHADPQAGFRAASEHYDNSARAVAVVRAHETKAGILVCGAICPDADDTAVAALRRSPLSGDWRRVGGNLELVAALAVNTPGFPVARPRVQLGLAAGGRQLSLVAAGAVMPLRGAGNSNVDRAVSKALDEWSRRRARLRVVSARMAAASPPAWSRTRAALAQARLDGTHTTIAAVAARHGYTAGGR